MFRRGSDAGVLFQRARGDNNYDASDHCQHPTGAGGNGGNYDNNDAPHGRRLLIRNAGAAVMGTGCCGHGLSGVLPVKAALNWTGHRLVATD